jgi:hypothetical protein
MLGNILPTELDDGQLRLQSLQFALAAQESERARLLAKYDEHINELKKAIKTLERELAHKSKSEPEKPVKKPKQPGKPKT